MAKEPSLLNQSDESTDSQPRKVSSHVSLAPEEYRPEKINDSLEPNPPDLTIEIPDVNPAPAQKEEPKKPSAEKPDALAGKADATAGQTKAVDGETHAVAGKAQAVTTKMDTAVEKTPAAPATAPAEKPAPPPPAAAPVVKSQQTQAANNTKPISPAVASVQAAAAESKPANAPANPDAIQSKAQTETVQQQPKELSPETNVAPAPVSASRQKTVSLLLPVTVGDFPRLKMMDASFTKFFDFTGVQEWLLVAKATELQEVQRRFDELPVSKKFKARVVSEVEFVPEFSANPNHMGWIKQQIIKLSAYKVARSDFVLTLDSDIICTRPVSVKDLVVNGKAKTNMEKNTSLLTSIPTWWDGAAKTLQLHIPSSNGWRFGVTPALLSTDILRGMEDHVRTTFKKELSQHLVDSIYNSYTEYPLYYTYAAATGMFEKYHTYDQDGVYKAYGLSMWWAQQFDSWDGNAAFDPASPGYFITMQSNTKIEPAKIWDKVRPWLQ